MTDDEHQPETDADGSGVSPQIEKLEDLKVELFEHFGRFTRWKALCQERDDTTIEEQIRLAEVVLAAESTGTVAEWLTYRLRLQGGKSFDVDEMLAESPS